ncbi:hypothetical protein [Microbulbifer rhizosphaerae]|uniref:Uncharacterized protein n=1 Tax=Microbulbifer rhizosphaerae TaxID=1562603 RepID=A0A7W4WG86_9GAMM|nr:hypothetical protein [Microbulbifer rhizosphaerae]MBB3063684.1 hypothetical protein [Microbulbifer rhizosphaerae]
MKESLETRFAKFLEHTVGAESIDALHTPSSNDPKMADYYLADRKIVAEFKSLNADQMAKGAAVVDEHLSNKEEVIFGTLPSSRITDSPEEEKALKHKIQDKMTTRIKKVCSKANKQLAKQFEKLPHLATGVLILINEDNTSLHPSMIAERVIDFAASQPRSIHYCLMIFESHKIKAMGKLLPYPLLLDLTRSARQRRSLGFLQSVQWQWAKTYGHTEKVLSDERNPIAYFPEDLTFGG